MSDMKRHVIPSWVIGVGLVAVPVAVFFATLLVAIMLAPRGCGVPTMLYAHAFIGGSTLLSIIVMLVVATRRFSRDESNDADPE
jgi:hypothetical protein